jgi:ABC-2 type transport system ATP-binding protein
MPILQFESVSLRYPRAASSALADVSMTLAPGIVGIVGANGAGKSSLLKLLLGSRKATSGFVTIDGDEPSLYRRRHGMGFIPEKPAFPAYLTVAEFLGGLRMVAGAGPPTQAEITLTASFGLADLNGERLGGLSLGQKRRVELAAALIGDPPLLLLDEPTNGLDPLAVASLRAAILACRRDKRVILVASHHLDELQRIADHVVMLDRGRLVGSWNGDEARDRAGSLETRFRALVGTHAS